MIKHRHIDKICICAAAAAILITAALYFGEDMGIPRASENPGYSYRLFDDSRVHTVNILCDDWEEFLEEAPEEEYISCAVEIDGERFDNVGLRAKGNNSLSLTEEYGLSRYSLKLEFDHFADGGNYYGLDKFSLDASFQDNSYLKTYMAYDMMDFMGVASPLCSFTDVFVNGEPWGLFLAVEEPEEAFVRRNFGRNHGQLYKPDYRSLEDENEDIALKYLGDDEKLYPGIFENAKFKTDKADRMRVIKALEILDSGENIGRAVDTEQTLRYFVVSVFVMNWDSYAGHTGHNYFLYEKDGILTILPWDYNLAFGTYAFGMSEPIRDTEVLINWPVDTPAEGDVMLNRPLYHNLMKDDEKFLRYHELFRRFLSEYFFSGEFEKTLRDAESLIAPHVESDPTAFCSRDDFHLAADTLYEVCMLRAESIEKQLAGELPSTIKEQESFTGEYVDCSAVDIRVLGDFGDLETAAARAAGR